MAAPRKYDDKTRSEIHRLVNLENKRSPEAARIIALGLADVPAQRIPEGTVKLIAKQERGDLTDRPKAQQLAHLLAGLVKATDAEISRVQANQGDDTADDLLKLARTIREIEPLLTDTPQGKGNTEPTGVAGRLAVAPEPAQHSNTQESGASPVSAHAAS